MSDVFDDTRLDDPDVLAAVDPSLRRLAEAGARIRTEAGESEAALLLLQQEAAPRAIVAAGADARLLRAVLEPWCPVPFVAWPGPSLPGWAGALDLVVVLAPGGGDVHAFSAVREAVRRGCSLITACPPHSLLAEHAAGRHSTILPTQTDDTLAVAVVMLEGLHSMGVGPEIDPEQVAGVLDDVAIACAPMRDISTNPAKELALALADSTPLVWGGSVLAARAARRVAEAVRRATGRPALAADAEHLHPVLAATRSRDLFADPLSEDGAVPLRPGLLVLDDGTEESSIREQRGWLSSTAEARDVHVQTITAVEGPEVARYAALLSTGLYTATYLGVGLNSAAGADRAPDMDS
jgi:hypothetical protein